MKTKSFLKIVIATLFAAVLTPSASLAKEEDSKPGLVLQEFTSELGSWKWNTRTADHPHVECSFGHFKIKGKGAHVSELAIFVKGNSVAPTTLFLLKERTLLGAASVEPGSKLTYVTLTGEPLVVNSETDLELRADFAGVTSGECQLTVASAWYGSAKNTPLYQTSCSGIDSGTVHFAPSVLHWAADSVEVVTGEGSTVFNFTVSVAADGGNFNFPKAEDFLFGLNEKGVGAVAVVYASKIVSSSGVPLIADGATEKFVLQVTLQKKGLPARSPGTTFSLQLYSVKWGSFTQTWGLEQFSRPVVFN